jgi:hypothetical protein
MSNFTVRRILLVASMLFCQVALADDTSKDTSKESSDKIVTDKSVLADQPQSELPFKLLAALKPVSMVDVDRVVESSDRAVQGCNRNGRRADTLAVLMTMTIDADGKVSEIEAAPESEDNGKAPAEAACLVRVAKKLKFPATGTVTHAQYPFMIVSRIKPTLAF